MNLWIQLKEQKQRQKHALTGWDHIRGWIGDLGRFWKPHCAVQRWSTWSCQWSQSYEFSTLPLWAVWLERQPWRIEKEWKDKMTQGHSNVCQKQPAIQCKSCHVNPSVYKKTERKKKREKERMRERERQENKSPKMSPTISMTASWIFPNKIWKSRLLKFNRWHSDTPCNSTESGLERGMVF